MGTSAAYSAPPSWGDLKGQVTRGAKSPNLNNDTIERLVHSFIDHNGGSTTIARGSSGGTVAKGTAARSIASRLGGFLTSVDQVGLDQALRDAGWGDLVNRPLHEVLPAILDRLGGPSSTIDDVDARMALARLQTQYFTADTKNELEQKLSDQAGNLETVLQDFFGFYLYEVFCRVFFERLEQRVGETTAQSFLDQIEAFIVATLANRTADRDIRTIDWSGQQGREMTMEIMETTLRGMARA